VHRNGGTGGITRLELQECSPRLRVAPAGVCLDVRIGGPWIAAQAARLGNDAAEAWYVSSC
jgi:hypothetical protein